MSNLEGSWQRTEVIGCLVMDAQRTTNLGGQVSNQGARRFARQR